MSAEYQAVPGSFRDPAGRVIVQGKRVFRTVMPSAAKRYTFARDGGIIAAAADAGYLVGTVEVAAPGHDPVFEGAAHVLEHDRIPYISYPYEWGFAQLKAAALHHLDFQAWLLERGATLSDASAYNVQFIGPRPVFIDVLSIVPYEPGQYWVGYRQFCEQFLNPLLLRALKDVPHNHWYRGALEGIGIEEFASLLGIRDRFSINILVHVLLHARLQRKARDNPQQAINRATVAGKLSLPALSGLLRSLRGWIARLKPRHAGGTTWADYATHNSYNSSEAKAKAEVIAQFVSREKPAIIMDLGCNSGDYSMVALENGASYAVGFDFDQTAVDLAYDRAQSEAASFLPLWLDAANPSPALGWKQAERAGFVERSSADAVMALAFEHHLAIGRNIPLPDVVDWIVSLAPKGVIEFVPKSDPTIQVMLSAREDIFPNYTEDRFRQALEDRAKITGSTKVSASDRVIYSYAR